jgi:excisionase family DNA binding protein
MDNLLTSESIQTYSVAEAAKKLGVSDTAIYRQIYAGNLKVLSGFGRIRVPHSELERLTGKLTTYEPRPRTPRKVRQPLKKHLVRKGMGV